MKIKTILISLSVLIVAGLVYVALTEKPGAGKSQEPRPPYPYRSEEVTFENVRSGITLSGTLTWPEKTGNCPAVVLITGSGPQDRNEQVFGHKPFLVLADHLTRHGVAVLRYDDRGGGHSTGTFMTATSLDFAADAKSAVAYLKSRKGIDPKKIGLAGHSEGGLIAPMAASQSNDVSFVISLAGPGVRCIDVMALQAVSIPRAAGVDQAGMAMIGRINRETIDILGKSSDTTELRASLTAYARAHGQDYPLQMLPAGQTKEEFFKNQIDAMCTPWYQFLYKADPAVFFGKVTCPVLALNGAKDLQVDAGQNLPAISRAVRNGGNPHVWVRELADLNHFFQTSRTGHPGEYASIGETFSPVALAAISDWVAEHIQ